MEVKLIFDNFNKDLFLILESMGFSLYLYNRFDPTEKIKMNPGNMDIIPYVVVANKSDVVYLGILNVSEDRINDDIRRVLVDCINGKYEYLTDYVIRKKL